MRIRAGIILVSDNKIALIKRVKAEKTYYVVPGGGVDDGEYTDEAAIREVVERVEHEQVTHLQMYYLVNMTGGVFGSGEGEEYQRSSERGTYEAVWMPLDELKQHHCYPSVVTNYLQEHGIPKHIEHLKEEHNYPS